MIPGTANLYGLEN